jgi:hypothetical protein
MELLQDLNRDYRRFRHNPRERAFLGLNGLQPVLSSNVSAVGVKGEDLIIRFHNGSVYAYRNRGNDYDKILQSNSKGKWVWRFLRRTNAFYEKLGMIPLPDDIGVTDEDIFQEIDNRYLSDLVRNVDVPVFQSFEFIKGINYHKIVVGDISVFKAITQPLAPAAQPITVAPSETIEKNILTEDYFQPNLTKPQIIDEIEKVTKDLYGKTLNTKKITFYNRENIDTYSLKSSTKQLYDLSNEYVSNIDEVRINYSRGGTLGHVERSFYKKSADNLNIKILSESEMRIRLKKAEIELQQRLDNTMAIVDILNADKYVVTHEFAHTLHNFEQEKQIKKVKLEIPNEQFSKAIKQIRKDYYKEIDKLIDLRYQAELSYFDGKIPSTLIGGYQWQSPEAKQYHQQLIDITISKYADFNEDEFFAESFVQAKLSSKPSPYAKKVLAEVDKYFRKGDSNDD